MKNFFLKIGRINDSHLLPWAIFVGLLVSVMVSCNPVYAIVVGGVNYPDLLPGQPVPNPVPFNALNAYSDKSIYYETQANGSAVARVGYPPSMQFLNGATDLTATNTLATTANPDGYAPRVNTAGVAVLESATDLALAAPAGSTPSPAVATAASTMAGGAPAPVATLTKTVPLGGGAGSLASKIGKGVLGVGAAGAAFLGSPALIGGLMALQVGMAGYDFYQSMKGQGLTFNADGTVMAAGVSGASVCGSQWCWPIVMSIAQAGYVLETVCGVAVGYPNLSWNGSSCFAPIAAPNPFPPGAGTVATNDKIQTALDSSTLNAHIAADLAALAIARNIPLPIPNGFPALSSPAVSAKSNFVQSSSTTDALGNTTTTVHRNVANVSPSANGTNPTLDMQRQTVTVLNGAPQSSTSTSLAPTIATNAATALAQSQPTKDLCVDHPEILACANIANVGDVPDTTPMLKKDINVAITPVVLPQNLICPKGVTHRAVLGGTQYWDIWGPACGFAPMMKPIVLAFAWLAAGMIVFVGRPYQ